MSFRIIVITLGSILLICIVGALTLLFSDFLPARTTFSESDGRKISITSSGEQFPENTVQEFSATYEVNHWPGTYKGVLQMFVESPDITSTSPAPEAITPDDQLGRVMLTWPYEIVNGGSFTVSFSAKIPPVGFKNREQMEIHAQTVDTYGPQYLNRDGTAPEGPLNVGRGHAEKFTILKASSTATESSQNKQENQTDSAQPASSSENSDTKTDSTSGQIQILFRKVYGHSPSATELSYWQGRLAEKKNLTALQGAMEFEKTKLTSAPAAPTLVPSPRSSPVSQSSTQTSSPRLPEAAPQPLNPIDLDGDGLPNDQEEIYGSNPQVFDTDGDGRPDGLEVSEGSSPVLPHNPEDFDNDGVSDTEELARGLNPRLADTDYDGVWDGEELQRGRNPLVNEDVQARTHAEEVPMPINTPANEESGTVRVINVLLSPFRALASWIRNLL